MMVTVNVTAPTRPVINVTARNPVATVTSPDTRVSVRAAAVNPSHSTLTDLDADDHAQYALVVVSASPPSSPRVGTVHVPAP